MYKAQSEVIKVSRAKSNTNYWQAVICIYELRFRAFLLHLFINIQRVDCESCKMLIERHYNLLPNRRVEQVLALSTTTQPVIASQT